MRIKIISIIVFCLLLISCNTNPSSGDSGINNQSSAPVYDYEQNLKKYKSNNSDIIKNRDVNKTLLKTEKAISNYLVDVGSVNECSKYTIDSRNLPNSKLMANPVSENKAEIIAKSIAKEATIYADKNNTTFDWSWNKGADIKYGRSNIDRKMNMISIEPIIKYRWCQEHENKLQEPIFSEHMYKYKIIFDDKYFHSLIVSKVEAINFGECRKKSEGFNYLPNGYRQIIYNTINSHDIVKYSTKRAWASTEAYSADTARYRGKMQGIFSSLPCDDFKLEYYELLKNADLKVQWY